MDLQAKGRHAIKEEQHLWTRTYGQDLSLANHSQAHKVREYLISGNQIMTIILLTLFKQIYLKPGLALLRILILIIGPVPHEQALRAVLLAIVSHTRSHGIITSI